ncbi:MAG: ATP-dependent sacrificial sulfur transferase LarE [Spirochaetia bacterium]|nr:ATP-dependent sacrificial sulfur transferase LarE [Spirochaetia bacterium]
MNIINSKISLSLKKKYTKLQEYLAKYPSLLIAYSGGVDSSFLLKTASIINRNTVCGVIADSPSLSRRELKFALDLAKKHKMRVQIIKSTELNDLNYQKNNMNRCFFCKTDLFNHLQNFAKKNNYLYIAEGTNYSDIKSHRPGHKAAEEKKILSPLVDCKLTKADIRKLSAILDLETKEKPQMACLASRLPYGESVSKKKLEKIEKAEAILYELGFNELRVRYHENGKLARIEVNPDEIKKLQLENIRKKIFIEFKKLGFLYTAIDIIGYRTGSANEN